MVTGLVCKSNSESFMYRCFIYDVMEPVLDLPIGYIGLSLGPQDPRGPPKNCGTHRVNAGIWSFRLNFVKNVCLNYYSRNLVSFNFRGHHARVFQRVSMNLNMTVGQAAHTKYCVGKHVGCVLRLLNRTDCYVWLQKICGCSCLKCTWSVA